jgi:hypothetical protein
MAAWTLQNFSIVGMDGEKQLDARDGGEELVADRCLFTRDGSHGVGVA